MGRCEKCQLKIDDKYKYCQECNTKFSQSNAVVEIAQNLKNINQNLGHLVALLSEIYPEQEKKLQADWEAKKSD